jgi:hypothetical protein
MVSVRRDSKELKLNNILQLSFSSPETWHLEMAYACYSKMLTEYGLNMDNIIHSIRKLNTIRQYLSIFDSEFF